VTVDLVPSSGGVFEVTMDGRNLYSKRSTGRHCTTEEIFALIDDGVE